MVRGRESKRERANQICPTRLVEKSLIAAEALMRKRNQTTAWTEELSRAIKHTQAA